MIDFVRIQVTQEFALIRTASSVFINSELCSDMVGIVRFQFYQ